MDYDKTLHRTYAEGRRLSDETVALWMDAAARFLRTDEALAILDLGSGTGRFSVPLAERFGANVIGVEPSEKMRRQAEAHSPHPRVTYLAGEAEQIPCADGSFDAAFLSMVIHHFRSMAEACRELFRVLRPGGIVLVRNAVKDRLDSVLFYSFFPSAKVADEARMPEMKDVVGAFERAGLDAIAHEIIIQQDDESLRLHLERIKLRALSSLMLISDEEFHNGVEAMERAAAAETAPRPVTVPIDLLVFRRRDKGRELPSG